MDFWKNYLVFFSLLKESATIISWICILLIQLRFVNWCFFFLILHYSRSLQSLKHEKIIFQEMCWRVVHAQRLQVLSYIYWECMYLTHLGTRPGVRGRPKSDFFGFKALKTHIFWTVMNLTIPKTCMKSSHHILSGKNIKIQLQVEVKCGNWSWTSTSTSTPTFFYKFVWV